MSVLIIANYLHRSKCQTEKLPTCLGRRKISSVWKSEIKEGKGEHWRKSLFVGKSTKTLCLCVGVKMGFDKCVEKEKENRKEKENINKMDKIRNTLLISGLLNCL